MSKKLFSTSAIMIAATMLACSDAVAPPKAATMEMVSFSYQQGFAGIVVADPPAVRVLDAGGTPVAGVPVLFAVTAGGGSITNTAVISNSVGYATAGKWVLGAALGSNTVVATADGLTSVEFNAVGRPVPTGTFELVSIDGKPLPFLDPYSPTLVVGGTFILTSSGSYGVSIRTKNITGVSVDESKTTGMFSPNAPTGLWFYLDNNSVWASGSIEGETLTANLWDDAEILRAYAFIKTKSE